MEERIIIIGSNGQIGTELAAALRDKFGSKNILTCDIKAPSQNDPNANFELLNVLDKAALQSIFKRHQPTQVYLLAALLSATGEQFPKKAWELNMDGLINVLDLAVEHKVSKIFWPSSIAVFGPHSPKDETPQYCVMDPNTVYGFSKLAGERWCEYYYQKHNLDIRSIRYPGLISWKAAPGGGTTDYAIHIFHEALSAGKYESFLSENTRLPMLYIDDAIKGTLQLMDAPAENLRIRSSYNLTGLSFTPSELGVEIQKHLTDFQLSYSENDPRQKIADSWPKSIDDSFAREDWGWNPQYNLSEMTKIMLKKLRKQ